MAQEMAAAYMRIYLMDDTATNTSHASILRLDLLEGGWSESEHNVPFLNEEVVTTSYGQHGTKAIGARQYPTISLVGRLSQFSHGSSTTLGTVEDHFLPGAKFASVASGDTASPWPSRQALVLYTMPDGTYRRRGWEDCTASVSVDQPADDVPRLSITLRPSGRIFADGEVVAREYGGSTSVPTWATIV